MLNGADASAPAARAEVLTKERRESAVFMVSGKDNELGRIGAIQKRNFGELIVNNYNVPFEYDHCFRRPC